MIDALNQGARNGDVGGSICTMINTQRAALGMSRDLSPADIKSITSICDAQYRIIQDEIENPHKDEFTVLVPSIKNGQCVSHQSRISFDFGQYLLKYYQDRFLGDSLAGVQASNFYTTHTSCPLGDYADEEGRMPEQNTLEDFALDFDFAKLMQLVVEGEMGQVASILLMNSNQKDESERHQDVKKRLFQVLSDEQKAELLKKILPKMDAFMAEAAKQEKTQDVLNKLQKTLDPKRPGYYYITPEIERALYAAMVSGVKFKDLLTPEALQAFNTPGAANTPPPHKAFMQVKNTDDNPQKIKKTLKTLVKIVDAQDVQPCQYGGFMAALTPDQIVTIKTLTTNYKNKLALFHFR